MRVQQARHLARGLADCAGFLGGFDQTFMQLLVFEA
jgi:hypothetical protein